MTILISDKISSKQNFKYTSKMLLISVCPLREWPGANSRLFKLACLLPMF